MPNPNSPAKPFAKGNQLYELALRSGKPKQFATPDDLWLAATKYFGYCIENPLPYFVLKNNEPVTRYRMQPMTWRGLCFYLGLDSFKHYKKLPDYTEVIDRISDVFHVYNFSGAATDQLKYKFIKRNRIF